MANWTNTSRAYLSGTITSTLVLDSTNAGAGSIPSSWNTYDDGTYNDSTYTPTAVFNGQVDTTIGRPRVHITQSGDSGDIKYRFRTSPDGSSYGSWSSLTDSYGKEYFDADNRWIDLEVVFYSPLWTDSDYFGIQTVGAQFIRFQKNETIYAEEMNSNFNYLGGNRLPYGGLYLLPTTGVYNLGSDVYYWSKLYAKNLILDTQTSLYFCDTVSTFDPQGSLTTIDIDNINGDNQEIITIRATGSENIFYLTFNHDSSSSYSYASGYRPTNSTNKVMSSTAPSSYIKAGNNIRIYSKTGNHRIIYSDFTLGVLFYSYCGIWQNSDDTITSIQLSTVPGASYTNTSIEVFVRK